MNHQQNMSLKNQKGDDGSPIRRYNFKAIVNGDKVKLHVNNEFFIFLIEENKLEKIFEDSDHYIFVKIHRKKVGDRWYNNPKYSIVKKSDKLNK